jgi:beta-glucanase (GH16 family)
MNTNKITSLWNLLAILLIVVSSFLASGEDLMDIVKPGKLICTAKTATFRLFFSHVSISPVIPVCSDIVNLFSAGQQPDSPYIDFLNALSATVEQGSIVLIPPPSFISALLDRIDPFGTNIDQPNAEVINLLALSQTLFPISGGEVGWTAGDALITENGSLMRINKQTENPDGLMIVAQHPGSFFPFYSETKLMGQPQSVCGAQVYQSSGFLIPVVDMEFDMVAQAPLPSTVEYEKVDDVVVEEEDDVEKEQATEDEEEDPIMLPPTTTTTSPSPPPVSPLPPPNPPSYPEGGWNLLWSDEFDGSAVDTSKWGFDTGTGNWGWGNNEVQFYRPENVVVQDGKLSIVGRREDYGGMPYTSARMKSNTAWHPGMTVDGKVINSIKVETKIKAPQPSLGLWAAFWMYPDTDRYGIWPGSGEIDIYELINGMTDLGCGLHYGGPSTEGLNTKIFNKYGTPTGQPWSAAFSVVAIEWSLDSISFFADGNLLQTIKSSSVDPQGGWWSKYGSDSAPFDAPFHIIMNLAIGGLYPNGGLLNTYPDANTVLPAEMTVDYVRVYGK